MNPDFKDILLEFYAASVDFLLVGAYALAAHGLLRATGDIDLWVRATPDNAERVLAALHKFGAPLTQISEGDFVTPGIVFQIGIAPRRIDILTSIDGVTFDEAWESRFATNVEGIDLAVIGRQMLLQNKRATGRAKDEVDADWLEK